MARVVVEGARYTLKPQRADAYGLPRGTTVTVAKVFTRPGYVALWIRAAELPPPENVFQASDLLS